MKLLFLILILTAGGFAYWKFEYSKKSNPSDYHGTTTHIVVKGDTLYSIATKYGTTVASIKNLNRFNSDIIHVGDSINIKATANNVPPASTAKVKQPSKKSNKTSSTKSSPPKPISKKQLPKSTVMESSNIGIDINDKNQVYLKTKDGKFAPAGAIIYGSDADVNGMEIKTITYRDLKGKETTLPGSADPESVIRLALKNQ